MKILAVNKFFYPREAPRLSSVGEIRTFSSAGHDVVPFSMASSAEPTVAIRQIFRQQSRNCAMEARASRARARRLRDPLFARGRTEAVALLGEVRPDIAHTKKSITNSRRRSAALRRHIFRGDGRSTTTSSSARRTRCTRKTASASGAAAGDSTGACSRDASKVREVRGAFARPRSTLHAAVGSYRKGRQFVRRPSRFMASKTVDLEWIPTVSCIFPNFVKPTSRRLRDGGRYVL